MEEQTPTPEPEQPKNLVEQAREENLSLTNTLAELKKVKDELAMLQSEKILAGENGGAVEAKPAPEVSDVDYAKAALNGEVANGEGAA